MNIWLHIDLAMDGSLKKERGDYQKGEGNQADLCGDVCGVYTTSKSNQLAGSLSGKVPP
jgi:hypothetical protein